MHPAAQVVAGYDLGAPARSFELPHKLHEISAIVAVGTDTVACLQDEKGVLFFFDLRLGSVRERRHFGPPGDYEGLARVGDVFWVLRSDGHLMSLRPEEREFAIDRTVAVTAPEREFEGLAYDPHQRVLIVAPKATPKGEGARRPLYAVDPTTGATAPVPYATIDRDTVLAAASQLGVTVPTKTSATGDLPRFRLKFAEVAVQPANGDLWLVSGVDRAVVVATRAGAILGVHFFAATELPQPEGATFLGDGSLVIASEGAGGAAVLRVYAKVR